MSIEVFRLGEITACVNYAILSHASLYMSMDYNMAHYDILTVTLVNFINTSIYLDEICKECVISHIL
jgi:hypothetical protein